MGRRVVSGLLWLSPFGVDFLRSHRACILSTGSTYLDRVPFPLSDAQFSRGGKLYHDFHTDHLLSDHLNATLLSSPPPT